MVALLSDLSRKLKEVGATKASPGHGNQGLVSNMVAKTLSPQEGSVVPRTPRPAGGSSGFSTTFKIWNNNEILSFSAEELFFFF